MNRFIQLDRYKNSQIVRQLDRQVDRQIDRQIDIKKDRTIDRQIDTLRAVFHKKLRYYHFNSKNILSVKKRLGFITKVKGRVDRQIYRKIDRLIDIKIRGRSLHQKGNPIKELNVTGCVYAIFLFQLLRRVGNHAKQVIFPEMNLSKNSVEILIT